MSNTVNKAATGKTKQATSAQARKQHHKKQLVDKVRIDAYITPESKAALKKIKAQFGEVKNEGQAIDKAITLASEVLKQAE